MELISSRTRTLLDLSMLKGVGPAALKKVATIDGFADMAIEDLGRAVAQIARALESEGAWMKAREAAAKQVAAADKHRARILSPLDADYPRLLAETKDDPFLLFIKGALAKDPDKAVAIIGTREPTTTGQVIAQRVAHTFLEQGWSIVSGLAIGCDAIAHRTALDAGGHTVAVLAHGLQMIAPSRHKGLAEEILEAGGALVSEYPFGQAVQSQQFVKRDRTQAGMAQGVVMIQSDVKGGSLHASRAALDYQRWLAVPYPMPKDVEQNEPKVQGNLLVADGSEAERSALLRCPVSALGRVRILHSRIDILRLAGANVELTDESADPPASESAVPADTDSSDQPVQSTAETAAVHTGAERTTEDEDSKGDDRQPSDVVGADEIVAEELALSPAEPVETAAANQSPIPAGEPGGHTKASKDRVRAPARAPGKRSVRYHVALRDANSSGELRIAQIPSSWIVAQTNDARATAYDVDLVVVLATRLEHIQVRVDEVKRTQASTAQALDKVKSLHLQFFVEDALMHMKRTVDDLALLESAKHPHVTVKVHRSKQLSLLEAKEAQAEHYVDLVSLLDQIVTSLPLSAAVSSGSWKSKTGVRRDDQIDIAFDDLVRSFNGLVSQALDVDDAASDINRSRDHASQSS